MVGDGNPKIVNLTGEPVNKLCHALPFLSLVVGIFQSVEVVELLRSRLESRSHRRCLIRNSSQLKGSPRSG